MPLSDPYVTPGWTPEELKRRLIDAQIALLRASAQKKPVLFLVEDLHWADPTTLEVLHEMIAATRYDRVFLLMSSRSDFSPPWADQPHATTHRLTGLSRGETTELVKSIVQAGGLSAEIIDQIVKRTDGVPLFIEELTKSTLESSDHTGVPASLHDSLMARLDRLGAAKETAQVASVIGRTFSLGELKPLTGLSQERVERALSQLVVAGLVNCRAVGRYEFKHALIRDAAYSSLLRAKRRQLHYAMARDLSEHIHGRRLPLELIAHHYTEADAFQDAVTWWIEAGRTARERSALREATAHFEQALLAYKNDPEPVRDDRRELEIQTALGSLHMATKGYASPEARAAYRRAAELADTIQDPRQQFRVLAGLRYTSQVGGDTEEALGYGEQCLRIAQTDTDPVLLSQANIMVGHSRVYQGRFEKGMVYLEAAFASYRPDDHQEHVALVGLDPGVFSLAMMGYSHWHLGNLTRAQSIEADCLVLAEELRNAQAIEQAMNLRFHLAQLRGDRVAARKLAEDDIRFCEERGFTMRLGMARAIRGWAMLNLGDPEEAFAELKGGIEATQATGARALESMYSHLLAEGYLELGRRDDAWSAIARAITLIDELGVRWWEAEHYRLRGVLCSLEKSADSDDEAERSFKRGISVARSQGARFWELAFG